MLSWEREFEAKVSRQQPTMNNEKTWGSTNPWHAINENNHHTLHEQSMKHLSPHVVCGMCCKITQKMVSVVTHFKHLSNLFIFHFICDQSFQFPSQKMQKEPMK